MKNCKKQLVTSKWKLNKVPGPEGIPSIALMEAVSCKPEELKTVFKNVWRKVTFRLSGKYKTQFYSLYLKRLPSAVISRYVYLTLQASFWDRLSVIGSRGM